MTVSMYTIKRIGKGRHIVGTLRKSDLENHAAPNPKGGPGGISDRLRYEVAQMVGGQIAKSILRARVAAYSDGAYSISPRDARGKQAIDREGNLITYWAFPYEFQVSKDVKAGV